MHGLALVDEEPVALALEDPGYVLGVKEARYLDAQVGGVMDHHLAKAVTHGGLEKSKCDVDLCGRSGSLTPEITAINLILEIPNPHPRWSDKLQVTRSLESISLPKQCAQTRSLKDPINCREL